MTEKTLSKEAEKQIKFGKHILKKYSPIIHSKQLFPFILNAVKLSRHYTQYGDFMHPGSKYNDQFLPQHYSDPTVNNLEWFAYYWNELRIWLNTLSHHYTDDALTQVNGYAMLVKVRVSRLL